MPPIYQNRHPLPEEGTPTKVTKILWDPYPLIYLDDHPHPLKGYPTADAIAAINVVKKLLPFFWVPRIHTAIMMALYPFVLEPRYMLPVSRAIRETRETSFSLILSHVLEYDSAYRVRFQFMLPPSLSFMSDRPIRSVLYMLRTNKRLDYIGAHRKIRLVGFAFIIALMVPSFRKSWRQFWQDVSFVDLLPDPIDYYWFSLRTDYGPNNMNTAPKSVVPFWVI